MKDKLQRIFEKYNMPTSNPFFMDVVDALSTEPCEDCISRQAVIHYIKGHIHEIISESGIDKNEHTNRVLRAIISGVETMPSVTPKTDVLDEVRAEIENYDNFIICANGQKGIHIDKALEIIDKYKAESEDK